MVRIAVRPISGRIIREIDLDMFSLIEASYPEGLYLGRHAHLDGFMTLPVSGAYEETVEHQYDQCLPGALRLLPPETPHENRYPGKANCLILRLPPATLRSDKYRFAQQQRPGKLKSESNALGWKLYREYRYFDEFSPLVIESLLCELLAENGRATQQTGRGIVVPSWLTRAREILHEKHASRVSLQNLSIEVGVHEVHLCREFKRHFGCTAGEFLRGVRVERACGLLLRTPHTISEIALACGFSDQSHFSAVFRKLTGTTPARFRSGK